MFIATMHAFINKRQTLDYIVILFFEILIVCQLAIFIGMMHAFLICLDIWQ